MRWLRRKSTATSAAAKRARAWVEVEQEMRLALESGIPPDELVAPMAEALRGQGLDSLADRMLEAARRARA